MLASASQREELTQVVLRVVQENRWWEMGIWGRLITRVQRGHHLKWNLGHGYSVFYTGQPAPSKTQGSFWASGQASLVHSSSHVLSHTVTGGVVSCVAPLGGFLDARAWFPLEFTPCIHSLCCSAYSQWGSESSYGITELGVILGTFYRGSDPPPVIPPLHLLTGVSPSKSPAHHLISFWHLLLGGPKTKY